MHPEKREPSTPGSVDEFLTPKGLVLIMPSRPAPRSWFHEEVRMDATGRRERPAAGPAPESGSGTGVMSDLIFVGLVVAFFAMSGLYVRFCDRL